MSHPDGVEAAAREHARRVVAGDGRVREDVAPGAALTPPDLLDRLLTGAVHGYEIVAHARIGAHHILKTRYRGRLALVVQARWVADGTGVWRIVEAEIARVASEEE